MKFIQIGEIACNVDHIVTIGEVTPTKHLRPNFYFEILLSTGIYHTVRPHPLTRANVERCREALIEQLNSDSLELKGVNEKD